MLFLKLNFNDTKYKIYNYLVYKYVDINSNFNKHKSHLWLWYIMMNLEWQPKLSLMIPVVNFFYSRALLSFDLWLKSWIILRLVDDILNVILYCWIVSLIEEDLKDWEKLLIRI